MTSWDSARGESIDSRPTAKSSTDYQPDLTLGPLDERIESDTDEGSDLEDFSGQWLANLKSANATALNKKAELSNSQSIEHRAARKAGNNSSLNNNSSKQTKSGKKGEKTKKRSKRDRSSGHSSKAETASFDSGLGHFHSPGDSEAHTSKHKGKDNLAFDGRLELCPF